MSFALSIGVAFLMLKIAQASGVAAKDAYMIMAIIMAGGLAGMLGE